MTFEKIFRRAAKAVRGRAKSGAESGALLVQNTVRAEADVYAPETTNAAEAIVFSGSRRVLSDGDQRGRVVECTRQELNPNPQEHSATMTCVESLIPSGAKSGAVGDTGQNLEVLAALVGILTPEQKAAFLALLSTPKPGG